MCPPFDRHGDPITPCGADFKFDRLFMAWLKQVRRKRWATPPTNGYGVMHGGLSDILFRGIR